MADKKISQLTALSAANVASATDVLAIVDTSATETKKITAKDLIDGALNGGTANGVLYLNGSKVATSGANLTYDGTTFTSVGQINVKNDLLLSDATAVQGRAYGDASGVVWRAESGLAQRWHIGSSEQMRLTTTGLGIGTASPAYKLDVNNGGGSVAGLRVSGNDQANVRMRLENSGSGGRTWELVGGLPGSNNTNFSIRDVTGSTTPLTLDSSGNLGIGTTSPSTFGLLAVVKDQTADTAIAVSNGGTSTAATTMSFALSESGTKQGWLRRYRDGSANTEIGFSDALLFTGNVTGTKAERGRFTAGGDFLVGKQTAGDATIAGCQFGTYGGILTRVSGDPLLVNRQTDDGTIVSIRQDNVEEGTISVSGNTVSYNAFAGSHWSQLQDGSKPDILRGTVMESINELCVWPGEQNERLPKSKISDTAGSKKVYGVFMAWDNDWTETNDMYVTAVGAFICRINSSVTVQEGDLLESNGDGTARVQADDIIRSSTIGKVTSTVKTHQYDDGSYCVPTVLYCG